MQLINCFTHKAKEQTVEKDKNKITYDLFHHVILSPNQMWISSGCGSEGFLTTQLMFYNM